MQLIDLEPQFLTITDPRTWHHVNDIQIAQGISFICPVCYRNNNGPVGIHSMICWFNGRGVPPDLKPGPGRWNPSGTGYSDLSFVGPGATSVLLQGSCNAHFHIVNGQIQIC